MSFSYLYIITPLISFFLMLIFISPLRQFATKINLVDNPNARKVHKTPIPLVGGLGIALSAGLVLLLMPDFSIVSTGQRSILIGALILLFIGCIDDRLDVRAIYKLMVQLLLAFIVFDAGIRIESLYGIFGIEELPIFAQYVLTVGVITGVVNAFNLMDGIDGLAAGLAILGVSAFSVLAVLQNNSFLVFLYLALTGALIGFLRFNLSKGKKIFMGDAGSLALGFVMVVSGIQLIQSAQVQGHLGLALAIVIGILALPVIDSLRVYRSRIKRGYSPFRPDKTHIHHLILSFGVRHQRASFLIILFAVGILAWSIFFGNYFSLTISLISTLFIFTSIVSLLGVNHEMSLWRQKLREIENF